MILRVRLLSSWILLAGIGGVLAASPRLATGQMVRPPDLGVWLSQQREANGNSALIVTDLLADGVLARSGLRTGDHIVALNGRAIGREQQFAEAFLTNPTVTLVVARGGQQQSLTLKSSAVMDGMVPLDPYYQGGFLVDEHRPESMTVERVFPATPAFYAGLKPDDVITSLNERPVSSTLELTKALRRGGPLRLSVHRAGQPRLLILTMPAASSRHSMISNILSGTSAPPPPLPSAALPSVPLLAPPAFSNPTPAIPSPPPAIPVLPPPGTVPGGT